MKSLQININELKSICLMDEKKLIPDQSNYYFKDNGSNILAVAHCDYVCNGTPDFASYSYKGTTYILSETLDDRLGVYLITKLLPSMGINVDVLLTTDEEIGLSTAQDFETDKQYNWIFSFDRRETDIVTYDYGDDEFDDLIYKATGQEVEWGSFSDIIYLEHLGVKGLNFGCGYSNEHTLKCFATTRKISRGLANFKSFYDKYKDTKLPHYATRRSYSTGLGYSRGRTDWYDRWDDDDETRLPKNDRMIRPTPLTTGELRKGGVYGTCDGCDNPLSYTKWCDDVQGYLCDGCMAELNTLLPQTEEDEFLLCDMCGWETIDHSKLQKRTVLDTERHLCYLCDEYIRSLGNDQKTLGKVKFFMDWPEDKEVDTE